MLAFMILQAGYPEKRHPAVVELWSFSIALMLLIAFIVCLCIGLQYLPSETTDNFTVPRVLLAISFVTLTVFVCQQRRTIGKRVVDVRLVADSTRWPFFLATFFREAGQLGVRILRPTFVNLTNMTIASVLDT
jgi:uncharacterized RDD family membrane protein YckC